MADLHFDVVLVGGGVMSATLGMLLRQLDPALKLAMVEKLPEVALESSDGWNNAGTGHAGYCELNYTPQQPDGGVAIERALNINAAFETSLQFWSWLVENKQLPAPRAFINPTPHLSVVWGKTDVDFLRQRFERLQQHHLFSDMEYSENPSRLAAWVPLVMEGRGTSQPVAATRVAYGTDVDFGALTRSLVASLQKHANFTLFTGHEVQALNQEKNGKWQIRLRGQDHTSTKLSAGFVFLGAGGGALTLLQKSGIAEGKGYGGFPVSGQWLICNKPEIVARHHAKVYGKAPIGAPPMSVPHLDTRIIGGKPALLFGPYAGFTTRFLKQGSTLDLLRSLNPGNLKSVTCAGLHNANLTRYLIREALQSHEQRVAALRRFHLPARPEDWALGIAGQRVQIIKGGKLEFGTEIVTANDGTLAALLGASPGASTSVEAMLNILQRCFGQMQSADWRKKLETMIPAYGQSLINDADLLHTVRRNTLSQLQLLP